MMTILAIVHVIFCLLLIALVLLQDPKNSGAGGMFGGGGTNTVLGSTGGALRDHKTLLQERVQATGAGKLRYIDTAQNGPPHDRVFSVEARLEDESGDRVLAAADGSSKKEAQQRAAELALLQWVSARATDEARPRSKR